MKTIEPMHMLYATTYLYFHDGKETAMTGITGRAFQMTKKTSKYIELFWLDTLEDDVMPRADVNNNVVLKSDII